MVVYCPIWNMTYCHFSQANAGPPCKGMREQEAFLEAGASGPCQVAVPGLATPWAQALGGCDHPPVVPRLLDYTVLNYPTCPGPSSGPEPKRLPSRGT